jgi:Ca2+-dependent lipid-binding protein
MVVEVLAARDIESTDFGGTSDPYCQLDLNSVKHKTKTIWKTLRPVWSERFEFVAGAYTRSHFSSG